MPGVGVLDRFRDLRKRPFTIFSESRLTNPAELGVDAPDAGVEPGPGVAK
jgi:hypothetical protein